ncbi:MAG: hypothetical protein ACM3MF_03145, partial [Anaerolineae bacterium]
MIPEVEAIFFDVNGTLRHTSPAEPERKSESVRQIMELLQAAGTVEEFSALLTARMGAYRTWARTTSSELTETELWTRWLLPDHPAEEIEALAPRLHQLWREDTGIRTFGPEALAVLTVLFRRG